MPRNLFRHGGNDHDSQSYKRGDHERHDHVDGDVHRVRFTRLSIKRSAALAALHMAEHPWPQRAAP